MDKNLNLEDTKKLKQKNEDINCNDNLENSLKIINFGEYYLCFNLGINIYKKLAESFGNFNATKLYILGILHYLHGFNDFKHIESYLKQSYFAIRFPSIKLKSKSIFELLDHLGRYTRQKENFIKRLFDSSSKKIVISKANVPMFITDYTQKEVVEYFYKDRRVNILNIYDLDNKYPIYFKMYHEDCIDFDQTIFKDTFNIFEFNDSLFLLDVPFLNKNTIKKCVSYNNQYIREININSKKASKYLDDLLLNDYFNYRFNDYVTLIQYKVNNENNKNTIIYRDCTKQAYAEDDYSLNYNGSIAPHILEKRYKEVSKKFGITILESNLDKTTKDIYSLYDSKNNINYSYLNNLNLDSKYLEDFFPADGSSFILLISELINQELLKISSLNNLDIKETLFEFKKLKLIKDENKCKLGNYSSLHKEIFTKFNIDISKDIKFLNDLIKN